jgi:hypothetical protein
MLAYSNSHVLDDNEEISENFYLNNGYYNDLVYPASRWNNDHVGNGNSEISNVLAIKNTIPNSSAVVFRKSAFYKVDLESMTNIEYGHDWMTYISIIKNGKIAYQANALNYHRRHRKSVISQSLDNHEKVLKEYFRIHQWIDANFDIPNTTREKIKTFMQNLYTDNFKGIKIDELRDIVEYYDLKP